MAQPVAVKILSLTSMDAPPSTVLEYEVHNEAEHAIWLVDDGWLVWRRDGRAIELSFARGSMQRGSHVFGYFNPAVTELARGARVARTVRLTWPQPLERLWNAESQAAPAPGRYPVRVRVGYGETPQPPSPTLGEAVEAPVLRWQREAVSAPVEMRIPSYAP